VDRALSILPFVVGNILVSGRSVFRWLDPFRGLGSGAISDTSWSSIGVRELRYLAFSVGIAFSVIGPAALCVYLSYMLGWSILLLVVAALIGVAEVVLGLRLTFILPAIALDNFHGLKLACKQTHSTVLRIMAVVALSGLPINCGTSIVARAESSVRPPSSLILLGAADLLLTFLSLAVQTGAIAICYRFRMGTQSLALPPGTDEVPAGERL
jgi:hypothetical protein